MDRGKDHGRRASGGAEVSSDGIKLYHQPISKSEANEYIKRHHRHHKPTQGWKFGIAVNDGEKVVGVAVVGRPVARHLDDGLTLELTRLCVNEEIKNAASFLLGKVRRAVFALGYSRLITYTLENEPGVSLLAAGWKLIGRRGGGKWDRCDRPRKDVHPIGVKLLWEG